MINDPVLIDDWHPVELSHELKEGGISAARVLGEDIVLWRLKGEVLAWRDLCLHRGTRLSLGRVENDNLVCPYHGWAYNGEGQCVHIPAHPDQVPPQKARARSYRVQERYGMVWVSLGDPAHDVPAYPEWDEPHYHKTFCGPYDIQASAPRVLENFVDVAHFPFVHDGLLGDQRYPQMEDYEVEVGSNGVIARDVRIWQPKPDGSDPEHPSSYTFHIQRPLTVYVVKPTAETRFAFFFTVTPVEKLVSRGWLWLSTDTAYDVPEDEIRAFQDELFDQDIPVVESQRPEMLPLDLQAELHLRSDRTAIAYRRWLNELGLTFGTA